MPPPCSAPPGCAGGQGCPAGGLCLITSSPCPRAITHCACGVKDFPESQPGEAAHPAHPACSSLWDLSLESLQPRGVSEEFGPGDRAGHIGSLVCPGAGDSSQAQFLVLVPAHGLRQCFPGFLPFPAFCGVVLGQAGGDPAPLPSKICHPPLPPLPCESQLPPQLCLVPSMALAACSSHRLGAFFLWFEEGGTGQARHPFDFGFVPMKSSQEQPNSSSLWCCHGIIWVPVVLML